MPIRMCKAVAKDINVLKWMNLNFKDATNTLNEKTKVKLPFKDNHDCHDLSHP